MGMGNRKNQLAAIRTARGSLKRKPGDKPFAEAWAEHKREEKELEEAKFVRRTSSVSKNLQEPKQLD